MLLWYPIMDLARAPRRSARKKGSGYENDIAHHSTKTIENCYYYRKLCENTPPFGRRVSTQFLVFPISTRVDSRANGAERRSGRKPGARVLIPPGYLQPRKGTH